MSSVLLKGDRVPLRLWADPAELEPEALQQLKNVTKLPWVFHHVAAMPDVHAGIGATIGSVIAMEGAVAPAAVGVDIGCGMAAVRTTLEAPALADKLPLLRSAIEATIPTGFDAHRQALDWAPARGLWKAFKDLHPLAKGLESKARHQLGTLGSGNHFIELCLDEEGRVWVMLHSGSRNIGKELADAHIRAAKRLDCNRSGGHALLAHRTGVQGGTKSELMRAGGPPLHGFDLPDPNLAVFLQGTPEFDRYWHDLTWAQAYAAENRAAMLDLLADVLVRITPGVRFETPISCHHNYVAEEIHFGTKVLVTRKGAIRARKDELALIPGSMGTRSYIVKGLGEPLSFMSASHGAGRRMSRTQARKRFKAADLAAQTEGVECRKDLGILDEIPGAYKDIDEVMDRQKDLVTPVHTLKQVLCVKG